MIKPKIIFEKKTVEGNYQAIKDESDVSKKIIMQFLKGDKPRIIWEIKLLNNKISLVAPFLGIKWPIFSAEKSKTFIEIPKQLTEIEKLNYPEYMRGFLTDSNSNTTPANLNLNGKRKNLSYFGRYIVNVGRCITTHKEFLKVLSEELGIKIKQFSE